MVVNCQIGPALGVAMLEGAVMSSVVSSSLLSLGVDML